MFASKLAEDSDRPDGAPLERELLLLLLGLLPEPDDVVVVLVRPDMPPAVLIPASPFIRPLCASDANGDEPGIEKPASEPRPG